MRSTESFVRFVEPTQGKVHTELNSCETAGREDAKGDSLGIIRI